MAYVSQEVYECIEKQSGDKIIEWRTCRLSGECFPIYQGEKDLLEKLAPVIGGKKMEYDLPHYCYRVRMLKRNLFRNEKKFYSAAWGTEGKKEISIVHESVRDILPPKDRYNEDFSTYGREYSGDFCEDLKKLYESVPYLARYVTNSENSEYCNQARNEKNCYLCVGGQNSENCLYSTHEVKSKYIVDSYGTFNSEILYQSIHVRNSMKAFFCMYLVNCYNTRCTYDSQNCKNVLFGFGLRDQEYVFKNKVYSKQEREKIFQEYADKIKTISGLQEVLIEYRAFLDTCPHEAVHNVQVEHSWGTQINNSKNMIFGFGTEINNDSRYCAVQGRSQNVMDLETSSMSQLTYNCIGSTQLYNCNSIASNFGEMRDAHYGLYMRGGNNLMGCFGLHNQSYHILNKKYNQEDREKISLDIVEELRAKQKRGDFLDTELSPFPYNDALVSKLFPIKQLKVGDTMTTIHADGIGTVEILNPEKFISDARLDLGGEEKRKIKWRTQEIEVNIPTNVDIVQASELMDSIDDVQQDICDKVIVCEKTGRLFKILPMELEFYKTYGLPLPTTHHEQRDTLRYEKMPSRFLEVYTCDKCGEKGISEYRKEHAYKVYCEKCYNKEIYG